MSKILKYGRGTQIGKEEVSSSVNLVKSEESIEGKTGLVFFFKRTWVCRERVPPPQGFDPKK